MKNSAQPLNAEIAVVGAGPAGVAAAIRGCESGANVIVIDDNPMPGGQIWRGGSHSWLHRFRAAKPHLIPSAQVVSADVNAQTLLVETPEQPLVIHFQKLILATGARELFLPFPGWTLPGVMGVGGLQALVKSGLPIGGKTIVVAGSGPLLLAAAAYLSNHGARVKIVAEQAPASALTRFATQLIPHPGKLLQAAALRLSLAGIPYRTACWIEAAEGRQRLNRVRIRAAGKTWTENCDYAAIAYGLYPNTELASLLDCRIQNQSVTVDEWQRSSLETIYCTGECTGIGGVDLSLIEGEIAGYTATGQTRKAATLFPKRAKARKFARALQSAFALRPELKSLPQPGTFVCRCEDVSFERLSNFPSFRAAKLHTRCGMGPCQARVCGPAMEFLFGWKTESVRPPIFPARIDTLAFYPLSSQEASVKS